MTTYCITNDVPDLRSCTSRHDHDGPCTGFAQGWDEETQRSFVDVDQACTGGRPSPAEVGRLCYSHVAKLDDALQQAPDFVATLWSMQSNGVRDDNSGGGHAAAGPRWPLIESRMQASWITASMLNAVRVLDGEDRDLKLVDIRALPGAASAREVRYIVATYARILDVGRDELAGTAQGAEAAVRFVEHVQRAMGQFPTRERKRHIAGIRCEKCHHAELEWRPPLAHRADVVIRCKFCGNEEPQSWLEQWHDILQMRAGLVS